MSFSYYDVVYMFQLYLVCLCTCIQSRIHCDAQHLLAKTCCGLRRPYKSSERCTGRAVLYIQYIQIAVSQLCVFISTMTYYCKLGWMVDELVRSCQTSRLEPDPRLQVYNHRFFFFFFFFLLFIHFSIYIEIFQCCLYLLWTIGAHSVQGSSQCPFCVAAAWTRTQTVAMPTWCTIALNDVGHPDPPQVYNHRLQVYNHR